MAAERMAAMIAAVTVEGNFDATEPQVLRWLSDAHMLMVMRSTCLRKRVPIATTVAGMAAYPLPEEVQEILEVTVGGIPYGTGKHSDIAANAGGYLWLSGPSGSGVTAADSSAGGQDELSLIPTPEQAGLAVEAFAVCGAEPLSATDDTFLSTPREFDQALVRGAVATGLGLSEARPDLAAVHTASFEGSCVELLKRVRRRYRGPRAAQIRVQGYQR